MSEELLSKLAKTTSSGPVKEIVFKNYHPKYEGQYKVESGHLNAVKKMEEQYSNKIQRLIQEYALADNANINLVPKKSNMDLKRIISDRIEKLEKKTEKSILEYAIELNKNK